MSTPPSKKREPISGQTLDLFAPSERAPLVPVRRLEPAPSERPGPASEPVTAPAAAEIDDWAPALIPDFAVEVELGAADPRNGTTQALLDMQGRSAAVPSLPVEGALEARRTRTTSPRIYQVAELVRLAARALEARFAEVWVEGEVSSLRTPGHVYFTLKDATAQLQAVIFRSDAQRLRFRLVDGLKVRVRGRLTIYPEQGKFQLYVDLVEPAGLGALQLAYEQLKRRLADEGLFRSERKRKLPFWPRTIGVATSPSGAAVRDIIRVAGRRAPVRILLVPCVVQGESAPQDIVRAIRTLDRRPEVSVIIVGRGGGSMEDLWAFNDEAVARAIAACRVPVISAVGHEIDVTIADFVADARAATPSQAAELVAPVYRELIERHEELQARLWRAGTRRVGLGRQALEDMMQRLTAALGRRLATQRRLLHALAHRLAELHPRARLLGNGAQLARLVSRLEHGLRTQLDARRQALRELMRRLDVALGQRLARRHREFAGLAAKLDALSPLRVLDRGYALVSGPSRALLTRAEAVHVGDAIVVRFADGHVSAQVTGVRRVEAGDVASAALDARGDDEAGGAGGAGDADDDR